MAWLRIDDGFPEHRKVLALKRTERWTWVELMCYCARQNDMGRVPHGVGDIVRGATRAFIRKCVDVGLIDETDEGLVVHDWLIYNADTIEAKVAAYLASHPEAGANEVQRAIGGKREIVLEVVRRHQENGSLLVPDAVPENHPSGSFSGTKSVHARAHPSPTPSTNKEPSLPSNESRAEPPEGQEGIEIGGILKEVDAA
jgi:hypothetical protein